MGKLLDKAKKLAEDLRPSYSNADADFPVGIGVTVIQDEGPPGLENTDGWRGLRGVIVNDEEPYTHGGYVAVEHVVSELPLPKHVIALADDENITFVWDKDAVKPNGSTVAA